MSSEPTSRERVVALAAQVLGSQDAAESWMSRPAMGLDHSRPIDLLQTEVGSQIVEDFLHRLEYCVYS